MWAHLVSAGLGVWLMAAPEVLGYRGAAATVDHVLGPLVVTFGTVACWEATRALRWLNGAVGLGLLAAPWLLGFPSAAALNSAAVGLLLALLSLVRGRVSRGFGGGWLSLWFTDRLADSTTVSGDTAGSSRE